jgi:8-oxo-dGTP diphosphatase
MVFNRQTNIEDVIYLNDVSVQAGGIYFSNNEVLLVRVECGANKGMWMIPGGFVELGESVEDAAIREFKEETGIITETSKIVGFRSGVQKNKNGMRTTLYIVFEMKYLSGEIKYDGSEISEAKFWDMRDVEKTDRIIELSKELVVAAYMSKNGLYCGDKVSTKNEYKHYKYYKPNPNEIDFESQF